MKTTNLQRIVILEAAIKAIMEHEPSLESWCRDCISKHIRIKIGDYIGDNYDVDFCSGFLEAIPLPPKNLRPRGTIQPSKEYYELFKKLRKELDELMAEVAEEPVDFEPAPDAEPEKAPELDSADTPDSPNSDKSPESPDNRVMTEPPKAKNRRKKRK